MNLQKRIFRVNMTMLVLSLIAMLGVSIYVVNSIYRNQGTWQSTSQKTAASQASLENFSGTDFSSLADELAKSGVQLYAESNGEVVFSNFKDDSENLTTISISATTHTSYVDGGVVISRKVATDGQM
ncbi:hypothetical protein MKM44_07705 [Streptococcus suis]|nr:hypothetical protein [Streptococcus suis]